MKPAYAHSRKPKRPAEAKPAQTAQRKGDSRDRERWEALGKPEIICHDKRDENGCMYIGPDPYGQRVCEVCGANEPKRETDKCRKCGQVTWWIPKCPKCGGRCTWTYGEIKPMEYERIRSANEKAQRPERE